MYYKFYWTYYKAVTLSCQDLIDQGLINQRFLIEENTVQCLCNAIFGSIEVESVINELCRKVTILQRNDRKMTISWSFSYNSFLKLHGKSTCVCCIQICVIKGLFCTTFVVKRNN